MLSNATLNYLIKLGATCTLILSSYASATTILSNQYTVSASATNISGNEWQFDYSVTNNNQSTGGYTGLDGLTIFIPTSASIVSYIAPAPYHGAPGHWTTGNSLGLNLGGDASQNVPAPNGFLAFTFWGQHPASVYTLGATANFRLILDNVSVGKNTIALSSYFGFSTPNSQYATNQHGNYSVYLDQEISPLGITVPEPGNLALLLAGMGLVGATRLRRKND